MDIRPIARDSDLVVQEIDDEIIVYDLKTNHALYLNETSAIIWNLCNGHRTVSEIRKKLEKEFNTMVSKDFVLFAIYQLRKDRLLTGDSEIDAHLKKFSGRTAIRKIKLGAKLALPAISKVLAPTAEAASCLTVPPLRGALETAKAAA